MADIHLTFPDGAVRAYASGTTGAEVAASIAKSLAKKSLAMKLDGVLSDLADPITSDAKFEIVTRESPEALELIRHDAAHVLAEAVQELWPGTQVTIGPVIENGFYYDFFRNEPFTPEDFPAIEKKMREIIARDAAFTKEVWDRETTKRVFKEKGEAFKVELVDAIPADQPIKIYKQGSWFDLCRGPHTPSTGKIGDAFKLMKVAGAYWRGDSNNPMLTRIYATAWRTREELDAYIVQLEEAEKRDHRRLGREMDLFHFQEEGPGVVSRHGDQGAAVEAGDGHAAKIGAGRRCLQTAVDESGDCVSSPRCGEGDREAVEGFLTRRRRAEEPLRRSADAARHLPIEDGEATH